MIHVPAAQRAGFKNCCLRKGLYEGSLRNYYFQILKLMRGGAFHGHPPRPFSAAFISIILRSYEQGSHSCRDGHLGRRQDCGGSGS
jgi:hypothetical protein